jgi:hypothetical protein
MLASSSRFAACGHEDLLENVLGGVVHYRRLATMFLVGCVNVDEMALDSF